MNFCSVYQLNIWRTGLDCKFLLTWDDRQQISAALSYPEELDRLTETWQYSYLKAYESTLRGRVEDEFSFTPSFSVDWKNRTESAEKELLQKFQRWLGSQELLPIREKIQGAVEEKKVTKKLWKTNDDCIDLLITCDSPELTRLPWEAWKIAPNAKIQISRTPLNVGNGAVFVERRGKPRILVILAANSELNVREDRRAVRSLNKVAQVEEVKFTLGENLDNFRQKLVEKLTDEIGWDILIFAGHSDETIHTGGRLELAPGVTISLSEIEFQLIQAIERGLKVAIFNSCCGTSLAEYSIGLGLHQVVAMREKISDRVAHAFLKQFCQSLAMHKDVQQSMQAACQYFEKEKSAYPSAYLIPSLFRHPSPKAKLFRIEPLGFQRWWRNWKPTRKEAIALSTVLFLSLLFPVQNFLLDWRILTQAIYRDLTRQTAPETQPPVTIIAIDTESIDQAKKQISQFEFLNHIDRRYLTQLINSLTNLNAKIIGINYLLDTEEIGNEELAQAIKSAQVKNNTWFVFASKQEEELFAFHRLVNSDRWYQQGDATFWLWDVKLPEEEKCPESCPFAYLLALSSQFKQNQTNFTNSPKVKFNSFIQENDLLTTWNRSLSHLNWRSIIDFSIPPEQVAKKIPAWQLLEANSIDIKQKEKFSNRIVLLTSGGYDKIDKYPLPIAINYWRCYSLDKINSSDKRQECQNNQKYFTSGEAHAYMIYQFLERRQIFLIPDFLLILLAATFGKFTIIYFQVNRKKKKRILSHWLGLTFIYIFVGIESYTLGLVVLPLFFPITIFWLYVFPQ
ncbi:MAG: CHASE2 domain-containing protein [Kamptonema sp. SIO1D9]|nr:CHASE2 domain-containing protein [Kamptonema sp. SIO1D9]